MAYTKPDQTPFSANLKDHEWVVTLDTGQNVAVCCEMSVEPNSGNPVVSACARVVNVDGTTAVDGIGKTMESTFPHTSTVQEVGEVGGVTALQKIALMAVLGESTAPLFTDPIHSTELLNWSIRTNIASAAHAGPVADLGSLL
jgi:hypothetical protein